MNSFCQSWCIFSFEKIALYHRRQSAVADTPSNLVLSMHVGSCDGRMDDLGNYNGGYTALKSIDIVTGRESDSRSAYESIRYLMTRFL